MTVIFYILLGLITLGTYLDFLVMLMMTFRIKASSFERSPAVLPKISILVAARNAQKVIEQCIFHLSRLNYPKEQFEILIGDDHSSDLTWESMLSAAGEYDNVQVFQYDWDEPMEQNGKAKTLEKLAEKASGDYFLIIDTDSIPHRDILRYLVSGFEDHTGIVNGFSYPRSNHFFSQIQKTDWIYHEMLIGLTSQLGFFTTAYGHNMMISKEAYYVAGGMKKIGKTLTEDFMLARNVHREGYDIRFILHESVVSTKSPKENWQEMIRQRVRWLTGAAGTTRVVAVTYIFRQCLLPFVALMAFFMPLPAFLIWMFRILTTATVLYRANRIFHTKLTWHHALFYDLYSFILFAQVVLIRLISRKVSWKGRIYRL
jgi:cellulose synthase/poly-beta-1,6-N-acetylglucosamine synthase-like glycosyltransferase